jgi:molecular chaperone GrpE
MKHKGKEKPEEQKQPKPKNGKPDFDALLDTLLQQKDELFEETFLTEDDRHLIDLLPDEFRQSVRDALLSKSVLFRKLYGKLQRLSADYANFQKRVPKQIADTINYEKEKIIRTLLPTLDNLEHTLQNAHSVENTESLIKGIQIIYDQMLDILKSHDVEQIKATGENFDPFLHQAMMQRAEPGREENIVLEEFQKGYKLNGRVIRPSKVIVNRLLLEQPQQPEEKPRQTKSPATEEYETTDME